MMRRQLDNIFLYNLVTIFKLHASYAILFFTEFFGKSQLLLINFMCFFMLYYVIYFQCLCYLALPLCIVSMHLTRRAL